jgi:magnesium-transporting ATPase (P-type)
VNDLESFRKKNPRVFSLPFNSKKKWMLSINSIEGQNGLRLLVKGAPERVMDMCTTVL